MGRLLGFLLGPFLLHMHVQSCTVKNLDNTIQNGRQIDAYLMQGQTTPNLDQAEGFKVYSFPLTVPESVHGQTLARYPANVG